MVNTAVSAISKYHVVDKDTGITIGQHSLVSMAKKAFWQQRPPLSQYYGTNNVKIVFSFRGKICKDKALSLRQLSKMCSCWCSLPCQGTVWCIGLIKT